MAYKIPDIQQRFALNDKIYLTAQILNNATLLVKNGKVESIAIDGTVPKGYVEINCTGKIIYPSFIELIGNYGVVQPKGEQPEYEDDDDSFKPQFLSKKAGAYHWNETIHPETQAYLLFKNDPKAAEQWRKTGFGAVLSHLQDGVVRGTGVLVTPLTIPGKISTSCASEPPLFIHSAKVLLRKITLHRC
ncbi:MAG: hypothetical protein IPL35_09335 [Sphingobacteriales bacterium]|nr:hypothetical protein [Sphingobacteriales bacterium]